MLVKKQTSKSVPEPLAPELAIWVGWSHLVESRKDLQEPKIAGATLGQPIKSAQLLAYLTALHGVKPDVLGVSAIDLMISDDQRENLMNALRDVAEPGRTFVVLRRFLEVVDAGNRVGRFRMRIRHLPAPEPPQQRSPFQHAIFEQMINFLPTKAAFEDSLGQSSPLSNDAQWGQILFSALVYGGLLKTKWLLAIPDALAFAEPDLRWIVLRPPALSKEKAAPAPRRWFPDPLTRLLLIKARQGKLGPIEVEARQEYRRVMKLIHAYGDERKFSDVLKVGYRSISRPATTSLHLHLPGWLVGYAAERHSSTSLPDWSWERLISPPTRIATELIHRERLRATAVPKSEEGDATEVVNTDEDGWPDQLRKLGSLILKGKSGLRNRIIKWRAHEEKNLLPSVNLLAKWVTESLLKSGAGWHPREFRTVYGMINAGGSRLVGQLGSMDPRGFSEDVFLELYQNALEDTVSVGVRRKVARALKSFHEFLVAESKKEAAEAKKKGIELAQDALVPSLAESGVFVVVGKSGGNVDANLISLDTFFRAMVWLRKAASQKHGESMAACLFLVSALGFFAGLRRSEAIGLCIGDILWEKRSLYVRIRKNSLRGLKTRAGNRILPTMDLMLYDAKKELIAWAEKRLSETGDPTLPLFPEFVRGGIANDKDPRLDLITEALQRAANDETLRYHHLRHSFGTWLLLTFVLAELGGAKALPEWFLPTEQDRARWNAAAYGRDAILGGTRISRRALLQVSHLLGHSGTDITLGSYIHLADFILGLFVRRLAPGLDDNTLGTLAGISKAYVAEIRQGTKAMKFDAGNATAALMIELGDRLVRAGSHKKKVRRSRKVNLSSSPVVEAPRAPGQYLLHVGRALHSIAGDILGIPAIATINGIPQERLTECYERILVMPAGAAFEHGDNPKNSNHALLELPVGDMQTGMALRTVDAIGSLYRDGDGEAASRLVTRRKLEALLGDFLKRWVPGTYLTMRFDGLPEAKRWIWFLGKLDLKDGVVVAHVAGSGTALPSAARQRDYWKDGLGVEFIEAARKQTACGMTRGMVDIWIDLSKIPAKKCSFNKPKGLFGVRFALVLTQAIGLRNLGFD